MSAKPRALLRIEYEKAADQYLHSLPPEHFMEATSQGIQRTIALESLDLVHAQRPEVQVFNELLVQYPHPRTQKIRQVVPDNLVVVHSEPIKAEGSFNVPFQPVGPFWVLEYVSKHNERKDYEDSFKKYEQELRVPYLLLFYPEPQDLTLYRHSRKKYISVKPNGTGRCSIAELDMEVAIVDGWVRFWFQGELLPLPGDMLREVRQMRGTLDEQRHQLDEQRHQLQETARRAEAAEQEVARLRALLRQKNGDRSS